MLLLPNFWPMTFLPQDRVTCGPPFRIDSAGMNG